MTPTATRHGSVARYEHFVNFWHKFVIPATLHPAGVIIFNAGQMTRLVQIHIPRNRPSFVHLHTSTIFSDASCHTSTLGLTGTGEVRSGLVWGTPRRGRFPLGCVTRRPREFTDRCHWDDLHLGANLQLSLHAG